MSRLGRLALGAWAHRALCSGGRQAEALRAPLYASLITASHEPSSSKSWYHTSRGAWAGVPAGAPTGAVATQDDKVAHLVDKDIWDEAWAYEPRFGTEDKPIEVPALLAERIIGVTDPEDDTLVIWGIIREGEAPKQLVAGGEFFVLKRVDKIDRVGDMLGVGVE